MESFDNEPFETKFSIYYDEVNRIPFLCELFFIDFYLGKI